MIAGIPTAKLRDSLTQMTANAGLYVDRDGPGLHLALAAVYWLPCCASTTQSLPVTTLRRW